ncbi:hypothetical protein [Azohydromonas aeria]|uniref:hypothetical protein n=1 Tax=Azohydromonas aeria TaxID=2590212 RepID=UPI0012FB2976|nr:hypothetical protein [Azohydromonas aeria]
MKRRFCIAAVVAALSLLGACGGGGSDGGASAGAGSLPASGSVAPTVPLAPDTTAGEYAMRVDAAEAQRKQVEDQVVDGPCESDNQCGLLTFRNHAASCFPTTSVPYLLAAPNADAVARGAEEFNQLSAQAAAVRPAADDPVMCSLMIQQVVPRCDVQSRKCVQGDGSIIRPPPAATR